MHAISPSDLKTILHSKRANLYYVERCRVLVNSGRVEYVTDEGNRALYWNIPIANTTTLLLGTGTSITQAAMRPFTVRDLRERTGELIRGAEQGHLSTVTKHGNPVFVAVPFDEVLRESGVRVSLALRLFDNGTLTPAQAA